MRLKPILLAKTLVRALVFSVVATQGFGQSSNLEGVPYPPELPDDVIVDILQRVEYSNEEVVKLYQQGGQLKTVAQMMMLDRLRTWGKVSLDDSDMPSQKILSDASEQFLALNQVWKDAKPFMYTLKPSSPADHAYLLGFDPFVNGRAVIAEKFSSGLTKLRLWDFNKGISRVIFRTLKPSISFPKIFFLRWNPNQFIVQDENQIFEINASDKVVKQKSLHSGLRSLEILIDQKLRRLILRDLSSQIQVIDLMGVKANQALLHDRVLKIFNLYGENDPYISLSNKSLKLWDRVTLQPMRTITSDINEQLYKRIAFRSPSNPAQIITLFRFGGVIQNIDVNNGNVVAEGFIPIACRSSEDSLSVAPDRDFLALVCGNRTFYVIDPTTLVLKGKITAPELLEGNLSKLPGNQDTFIYWDKSKEEINLFNAKRNAFLGQLGGTCSGNWLERICRRIGVLESESYAIKYLAFNPWQHDKILSSNGQNLVFWNLNNSQVNSISHPLASFHTGQYLHVNQGDPNRVILLNKDGSISVWDFWAAAKVYLQHSSL